MNTTERKRPTWDEYGMLLAHTAAQRSPDPYVIVGAAAFRSDHSTVATGYNGALPGLEIDWSDRDARRPLVLHAEYNCLKYTQPGEVHYLYVTMLPCRKCLDMIDEYGVKEVIYDQIYDKDCSSLTRAASLKIVIRQLTLSDEILRKNQ
jgi:deoxycytidylate deaminase